MSSPRELCYKYKLCKCMYVMYVGAKLATGERQVYAVCKANRYYIYIIYIYIYYYIESFTRRRVEAKKIKICIEISDLIMTMVTDTIVRKT